MSLTIPVVRSWRLDTITAQVALLREDVRIFDEAATAVRRGADRHLGLLEGDTVTASARGCGAVSRDLGILADKTEGLVSALDAFQHEATVHRTNLLRLVELAGLKGFAVHDDGALTPPRVTGDPADPGVAAERSRIAEEATALREDIAAELRTLERIDLDAGNALRLMAMEESYGFHPNHDRSDNSDPRTTIAGMAVSSQTDGLAAAMQAMGAGGSGLAKALPVIGPALGFGIGVLGASQKEPIEETLVAEGAGAVAGATTAAGATVLTAGLVSIGSSLATGAVTGATGGSVIPGIGTVAGLVVGGIVGGITGFYTSRGVREHFDNRREQGQEPFS